MQSKNYIQLQFVTTTVEQSEILIALLVDAGVEGFEETESTVLAFMEVGNFNKVAIDAIGLSLGVTYTATIIEQENWNATWERSFEPVIINDFAAIRAAFHQPVKNVQHEIIITPKMSFGTGHHATTWLMIELMSQLNFTGKTVLDFGTGTGILAILASKMGASNVVAIDNDDWSIENANENILQNNCKDIELQKANKVQREGRYDIVLANINRNIIIDNMSTLAAVCSKNGVLLLSGFLYSDLEEVKKSISYNELIFNTFHQKVDWISALATKPG
jgi:ribosomal protein L11 methyltransferase